MPNPDVAQLVSRRICKGMKVCVFIAMSKGEKDNGIIETSKNFEIILNAAFTN